MATEVLSARLPQRELAIAAYEARMLDCTTAEITKYAILRFIGYSHADARETALSLRKTAHDLPDIEKVTSVQVPGEWIKAAKEKAPDINTSTLYRFVLIKLTEPDSEKAFSEAIRQMGRPRKTQAA